MADTTILDFVQTHVRERASATAARVKRGGKYEDVTWASMWADARIVAKGLIGLGIESDQHICLMASSRLEWVVCDLGILASGAVTVPIYPSNLPEECRYIAQNAEARVIFAEDAKQVAKFVGSKDELGAQVIAVVQMTGRVEVDDSWVLSWDQFVAKGNDVTDAQVDERIAGLKGSTIATIIYTSGTTGLPKGVVLTHDSLVYEGKAVRDIDVVRSDDVQLLFLPLAHVFAKVLEVAWFACGFVTAFAESMDTIKTNLGEVRPTLMAGVPRVFEKFYGAVLDKGLSATGLKRRLFESALALSVKNGEAEEAGRSLGFIDGIRFGVLKKLVFKKVGQGIGETMGGRMRVMVSGGAPLSKKIAWFFRDAGLVIVEGYGMTETSAATCVNLPSNNFIGTVGPAVPGTEVKIAADGEILVRGPGVMREYWRNAEATAETIVDGWLHTGDIGELVGPTKALRITDRKKDLIITAGGKNVAPQKIENLLKNHALISQAVVHGDKRKFLSVLLTLDAAAVTAYAQAHNLSGSYAELTQHPQIAKEIESILEQTNRELASYESVKKFKVLETDFSIETGELTPKMSVKRKVINSRYGHIFDGFYAEKF